MRFARATAAVRVPATSGNLGPGFDSMGMAHNLWDEVHVRLTTGATRVVIQGQGRASLPTDESHLIVRAMRRGFQAAGLPEAGIELTCRNGIYQGRGLGSSAAAVVAGLLLVRGLVDHPEEFDDAAVLSLATGFEGHPDNAAPALHGGIVLSWVKDDPGRAAPPAEPGVGEASGPAGAGGFAHADGSACAKRSTHADGPAPPGEAGEGSPSPAVGVARIEVAPEVRTTLLVPNAELATREARSVLPSEVPHADAAFTAARAGLLVVALERSPELLFEATRERLHQDYRADSMPQSAEVLRALREAGWPAVISGAGPSILVFDEVDRKTADLLADRGFRALRSGVGRKAHLIDV